MQLDHALLPTWRTLQPDDSNLVDKLRRYSRSESVAEIFVGHKGPTHRRHRGLVKLLKLEIRLEPRRKNQRRAQLLPGGRNGYSELECETQCNNW